MLVLLRLRLRLLLLLVRIDEMHLLLWLHTKIIVALLERSVLVHHRVEHVAKRLL